MGTAAQATTLFLQARDLLVTYREDYEAAYRQFAWPQFETFNWALDYFDVYARGNQRPALRIIEEDGSEVTFSFDTIRERSNQVANFLKRLGVRRGDRILLMLGNQPQLWELTLGAMKLGAVVSPAATLLTPADLQDRVTRGHITIAVTDPSCAGKFASVNGLQAKILVGETLPGWISYDEVDGQSVTFQSGDPPTRAADPFLLYFTSGTTAKPKMVLHTHTSYPVGHLSTMYWIGLREGDQHLNISSPGWAKHAWSSFFAPWNAGATIVAYNQARFQARKLLELLNRGEITTLCAPPTVWRMVILEDLAVYRNLALRELVSAGEPLNPEVIEQVQAAWGRTIRDGYGQTETTALVGNSPGQPVKPGSMGRPLPGYTVVALDEAGQPSNEGEIAVRVEPRPVGLMAGYADDPARAVATDGYYRTGDVAIIDEDGYFWYIGRADDVFKSADYRISPFEIESALIEHEAVAEAAVVPSPDPIRLTVPKAFVVLKPGVEPSAETARELFRFLRERLAPYKRVRRLQFAELPKTISGKIRRVELRAYERQLRSEGGRAALEFWEEDFPELQTRA
jgi:acetyl-CoA synthetase